MLLIQKAEKLEQNFKRIVTDNYSAIFCIIAFVLSVVARRALFDFVSLDANLYLLPWYDEIVKKGRIGALSYQIGNYNMTYQFLIALMSYLPLKPLYCYKLLSCIFDYALAGLIGEVVYELTRDKDKKVLAMMIVF